MSEATELTTFNLSRALKDGIMHRCLSRLKPHLTEANKQERLATAGSKAGTMPEVEILGMWDIVHLDEEWYKVFRKTYLVEGEDVGFRACKSNCFVPKLMFLCAFARPCEEDGFDGKIGMWPFVSQAPAVRNSRDRPAGTIVTTVINVDAATYRDYVLNRVVLAVKEKYCNSNKRVVLQHDNATPHRSIDDAALAQVSTDGWTFVVRRQPPNSPDLNVLNL
ncbi:hypothetical protein H257_16013 [Aphanomyces astaci]|uniref:Uncharacterized protein n=1 Tax=Aphanomyces astaci TaxID=112090 RepID=W4FMG2_APHAT|nr:hypothetical protein H257_16013 [Aphanomyces astaci]ETV67888.1 hypothetical protein H257_16013 [Aphanomyces astaci]|eukprot:XP_009842633.1 hypothetical protein H257_16013 [Aphanomyces astaci]